MLPEIPLWWRFFCRIGFRGVLFMTSARRSIESIDEIIMNVIYMFYENQVPASRWPRVIRLYRQAKEFFPFYPNQTLVKTLARSYARKAAHDI